jgi:hypothetical protein
VTSLTALRAVAVASEKRAARILRAPEVREVEEVMAADQSSAQARFQSG